MRTRELGVVLMVLAACEGGGMSGAPDDPTPGPDVPDAAPPTPPDGGDPAPPDAPRDASPDAPPDDGCAAPPTGDWAGSTTYFGQGSGPHQSDGADVTWTLVSTEGCVDRYAPSGTAWIDNQGYVCEANYATSAPIAAGDGVLTVDRSTAPPTYTMTGATSWQHTPDCPEAEPMTVRSTWASYRGVIDEDVFGGGHRQGENIYWEWRFARVGADLPAPDGCAEPAEETWTGMHAVTGPGTDDLVANVTWTRVSTEGCVDRFEPSGAATFVLQPQSPCVMHWFEPGEGAVEPTDGFLAIDRSTNPPTFVTQASVGWEGTVYCTRDDGTTTSYVSTRGEQWDEYGPLDGDVVAGGLVRTYTDHAWRLER